MKKILSIITIVLATAALATATTATATYADSTQRPESDGVTIVETQVEYPHSTHPNDDTEGEQPTQPTQPTQPGTPAHNPLPKCEMPDVSHNERDAGDEEEFTYVNFDYNPLPQDVIDFLLGEGEATDTVMAFVDTYKWECNRCKNDCTADDMCSDEETLEQRRATRMAAELPHRCAEAAAQYMRIQLVSAKKSLYTLQNLFADAKHSGMEVATLARDVDILFEELKEVYDEAHLIMDQDHILWDAFWDVFDTYFDVFHLDHDIRDYEYTLRNPIPKK